MSKHFSVNDFKKAKIDKRKISVLTAYDRFTARVVEDGGTDAILVGDSLGMTVLGYDDTLSVTMEDMVRHTRAVSRTAKNSFVIADMPFLSYQISVETALQNAGRLVVEGGCGAVKLEGGKEYCSQVKAIVSAGIPVMGHLGFTPQSINKFGGTFVSGKTEKSAVKLMEDALALQDAGVFSIVLECVPYELSKLISERLAVPTIGIGSGPDCDGQVLVIHDILGMNDSFSAKHFKTFAKIQGVATDAVKKYVEEVGAVSFPTNENSFIVEKEVLEGFKRGTYNWK